MRPSIKLDDYESFTLFSKGFVSEKIDIKKASVVVKFCRFIKRFQLVGKDKEYNEWVDFIRKKISSDKIDQYIEDFIEHAYFEDNTTAFDFLVTNDLDIIDDYRKITYEMYTYVVPESCKMG